MLQTHRSTLLLALAGLLILSGCRTYGGYDSKPKTYAAMQKAVQSFEGDLERAKTDLQKLERAATEVGTLQAQAEEFHSLVGEHESLLETQQDRVERLGPGATYRNLHQAYGATVTEQRLMRQKYQRVIRTVYATVQDTVLQETTPKAGRRYTVRPIGFPSSEDGKQLSMQDALRGL